MGPICLQGPHHSAQKSTTIGFSDFNIIYGNWMGKRTNYPARTTIGVFDLPSNVILEMAFTLSK